MNSVLRTAVISVGSILCVLIVSAGGLWIALQPPRLAVPEREELVLSGVTVINPGMDRSSGRKLTVRSGRIASITSEANAASEESGTGRLVGGYVLPGLIDMHVHLPPRLLVGHSDLFGALFLAHGVTAIREAGSIDGSSLAVREAVREGRLAAPRVFACGPFVDGDPPVWPIARVARTDSEGREIVTDLAAQGVDCIKVYDHLAPRVLAAIHEAAKTRGLPVIGHVPAQVRWQNPWIDDVQHVCEPRCASLRGSDVERIVAGAVRFEVRHTPTLVVFDEQKSPAEYAARLREPKSLLLPRFWREVIWHPRHRFRFRRALPEEQARYDRIRDQVAPRIHATVRRLHEVGVRIHAGTDFPNSFVIPGASLHQELRLLVEIGMTPEEAWRGATRFAGESLGEPGLGVVREGAPADLLLFREDPTKDLSALTSLQAVIADGRLYPKETLDAALAQQQKHFNGALYDTVSIAAAKAAVFAIQRVLY